MISRTQTHLAALAFLIFGIQSLFAVPQLKLTDAKELEITAEDGTTAKLPTGTIGRQISADKQIFKVSYGKDLRGRTNIIIYPDPEKPQALELKALGQDVKLTDDAVLTIVSDDASSIAQFQSGMIGTVTVGAEQLTGGASAKLSQGSLSTVAANVPVFAPEPPKTTSSNSASNDPQSDSRSSSTPDGDGIIAKYEGPKVRAIEGDVMIAPPGQNVLDMVKSSGTVPRLEQEQRIEPGSTIQTGPQGKAIVSPFPGCVIAIQPNSTITFDDVDYVNKDQGTGKKMTAAAVPMGSGMEYVRTKHNYDHKVHLNLKEGGVISIIEGIKPENMDYQVKTPLAVAAARGTIFGVFGDPSKTLVIIGKGVVEIKTTNGTFKLSKGAGGKVLVTKDGGAPIEFDATPDELAAFQSLVDSIADYLNKPDILATGDKIGIPLDVDEKLKDAISDFQEEFRPRMNNFFMTPITSP